MKHFRQIEAEKTKAKFGIKERYFENTNDYRPEIRRDTFCCWQKCGNFHNPTRDN